MKSESIFKIFVKYVSQNVIGMIGLSCYILADTFFVSKGLGANGLTALNLAISIYSFIHGTGLMIGIGGATRFSILKSHKDDHGANSAFSHSIWMSLAAGIFFFLFGLFGSGFLSRILGADNTTFALTNSYLKTIMCFAPFFILNNTLLAFVRNDGNPKLAMIGMLVGSLSNIILDYIFIFPLGMGMFGAAFATGLAPVISIGLLSIHFIKKKNQFHLIKCPISFHAIRKISALGVSSLISEISSGVVLIVFNLSILSLVGNVGVAAYGVVANLALVAVSCYTGIAQGIQPIVSRSYGAGERKQPLQILRYALITALVFSAVLYALVWLFAAPLTAIFNSENNATLATLAASGLRLYFTGFIFCGINIIGASYFSSTDLPSKGFIISVTRGIIAIIPSVLLLSSLFGMTGVWLSFTSAEIITALVTLLCFVNFKKRR